MIDEDPRDDEIVRLNGLLDMAMKREQSLAKELDDARRALDPDNNLDSLTVAQIAALRSLDK